MAYYAVITDDHSGEELARYTLADTDLLDCELYAQRYAGEQGIAVSGPEEDKYIPSGCADLTVTLTEQPGSVLCWNSQSYFITPDEY